MYLDSIVERVNTVTHPAWQHLRAVQRAPYRQHSDTFEWLLGACIVIKRDGCAQRHRALNVLERAGNTGCHLIIGHAVSPQRLSVFYSRNVRHWVAINVDEKQIDGVPVRLSKRQKINL